MKTIEEIDRAIGAHSMWKARLKVAIDTGKIDVSVETIRQDNVCDLGKWLYGDTLTPAEKASSHYNKVRKLHAEFHKVAARVVELALSGKKAEAYAMMAPVGEYTTISSKLVQALKEWKEALK